MFCTLQIHGENVDKDDEFQMKASVQQSTKLPRVSYRVRHGSIPVTPICSTYSNSESTIESIPPRTSQQSPGPISGIILDCSAM